MVAAEFDRHLVTLAPTLSRLSRKFVKSREESADLVQETILKALRYRKSFREDRNLSGWLFIIMRNTFINQYRKELIDRAKVSIDDAWAMHKYDSNDYADGRVRVREVWEAIDSIQSELRKPLKMYLSGYKYEEIAKEMNLPLGTVKSRIFTSRKELRNLLPGAVEHLTKANTI